MAAKQGDSAAQCSLGLMYYNGQGVTQDYSEALRWYRTAVEQGNADAMFHIGWMYYLGTGVSKDLTEAKRWWEKSASQGNKFASDNLRNLF